MIQSMTGFGKAIKQLPNKKIIVEIKTLNSKTLDINTRLPSAYREKELAIRATLANALERGKIEFNLHLESTAEETSSKVNIQVVKAYIKQLSEIENSSRIELLKMAIRMPDALKIEREEIDEAEYQHILNAINQALQELLKYRLDEGQILKNDFILRVQNIGVLLENVIAIDPQRLQGVKDRLRKALSDIKEQVDENRFEQELIYYLEKFDITEEKVRLETHLNYFKEALNDTQSNGKKLAFITQEMGREINTIGSKSNYAPMQKIVVQMKDELEKIKEQLLNVL